MNSRAISPTFLTETNQTGLGRMFFLLALLITPFLFGAFMIIYVSDISAIQEATKWFDPIFFQYNVLLVLTFVLIIPTVTYVYVENMRQERLARLERELSEPQWKTWEEHIHKSINIQFGLRNYLGSTATLMLIVALGFTVILLLKPLPFGSDEKFGSGLNYGKGANLFLLGPFVESYTSDPTAFYHRLIVSLSAFQFGFLGGYVFFINHLVRSYFTLDLTPNLFISVSSRIVASSFIALVISFVLPEMDFLKGQSDRQLLAFIPLVSFFIGLFPNKGLLLIEKLSSAALSIGNENYPSRSLSTLPGMSPEHEIRLRREGYDNIENLAQAEPLGLTIRTGFSYRQLSDWIGQSWMLIHMGNDYDTFKAATGICSGGDLGHFLQSHSGKSDDEIFELLNLATAEKLQAKIRIISKLLAEDKVQMEFAQQS